MWREAGLRASVAAAAGSGYFTGNLFSTAVRKNRGYRTPILTPEQGGKKTEIHAFLRSATLFFRNRWKFFRILRTIFPSERVLVSRETLYLSNWRACQSCAVRCTAIAVVLETRRPLGDVAYQEADPCCS